MKTKIRVVIDTNVLISAAFFRQSIPWQVVRTVFAAHIPLFTEQTFNEFREVLERDKFDRYATRTDRREYLNFIAQHAVHVLVTKRYTLCRDPKDDKFLDAALNGRANYLITGDEDLAAMGSMEDVCICSPKAFLSFVS